MSEIYEEAISRFNSGWYCGESVLATVTEKMAITSEHIPAMATGFCSGMARTCGMCGAVTGGILALNLHYGRKSAEESVERNYKAVQMLLERFTREFSSTNCQQLLDCDLGTPEGQKMFEEQELWQRCHHFTGKASDMTLNVIGELERAQP